MEILAGIGFFVFFILFFVGMYYLAGRHYGPSWYDRGKSTARLAISYKDVSSIESWHFDGAGKGIFGWQHDFDKGWNEELYANGLPTLPDYEPSAIAKQRALDNAKSKFFG